MSTIKLWNIGGTALLTVLLITASLAQVHAQVGTTQTVTGSAAGPNTMPVLYNASGTSMNSTSNTSLNTSFPAGWYYLANGQQVYYYGNGTYYNPAIGQYGGSISNPTGMSGVTLYPGTSGTVMTPGVPNTGAGGTAAGNWLLLAISGGGILLGGTYMTTRKSAYAKVRK